MYLLRNTNKNVLKYDEKYLLQNHKILDDITIIYEPKFDIEDIIPNKLYHLSIQEYENKC